MSTSEKVLVEIVVAASPQQVWRALREPAEILRWFGWEYDELAGEIELIFVTGAVVVEEGKRLSFPYAGDVFVIEPRGQQTVVRVVRSAPAGTDWDGIYDDIVEGWRTFVQQLGFALGPQAGAARRTLYFAGRARDGAQPPFAALGLPALAAIPAGAPYSLSTPTGDTLTGTVWFHSAHQSGVTVDGFGNGLLVVHDQPATPAKPNGSGMAVLTTYGLSDEAFDALRARWTRWWESAFEKPTVQAAPHQTS